MYTWLVELRFGLAGVLSTVTMGVTLRTDNCGAVNSIAQISPEIAVLEQSKFGFKAFVKLQTLASHRLRSELAPVRRLRIHGSLSASGITLMLFRSDEVTMSSLPLEVVVMFGQTIAKVVPITIGAGGGVLGADPFLGLQSRRAVVAQARDRHRHLLLVLRSVVRAGVPDRAAGARRRRRLQDPRRRRSDRLLRQRPRPAVASCRYGCRRCCSWLLSDFMLYWLHRMFHGGGFWKYHAIHHSSRISTGFRRRASTRSTCCSEPSRSTSSC